MKTATFSRCVPAGELARMRRLVPRDRCATPDADVLPESAETALTESIAGMLPPIVAGSAEGIS
jgi:hypothetical protein